MKVQLNEAQEPIKLCECGCGQVAPKAKRTNTTLGYIKGQQLRFIAGHNLRSKHPGKTYRKDGYVLIQTNNGRELEHLIVAEKMIGRKLTKDEIVHHINGKRDDNRPENLRVLSGHEKHVDVHTSKRREKYPDGFKSCPKCGVIKPFSDFHKNKSKSNGMNSNCKICHNNQIQRRRQREKKTTRSTK